jgi:imidazole glycerol-phosphate synthase subunit HisH
MELAIVRYNAGNIQSLLYALERLNVHPIVSDNPNVLQRADKVIFPGVGEASTAMKYLRERNLDTIITQLKQPVLGICLGLQLLCSFSEENATECMGVFSSAVRKFVQPIAEESNTPQSERMQMKIPHIGWNRLQPLAQEKEHPLFQGLNSSQYVYYVHSYYAEVSSQTIASTDYIVPFSAALHKNNFYAVQFHPEKSSEAGATILHNFLQL